MAASDNVVSGVYALAELEDGTDLTDFVAWTMTGGEDDVNYVAASTGRTRRRVDGNIDKSGTLVCIYNVDDPIHDVLPDGALVVLHLFIREPSVGVTGIYHKVPAKILSSDEGANRESPEAYRVTFNWVLNTTTSDPAILMNQVAPALES
jgi:hypothetical protein